MTGDTPADIAELVSALGHDFNDPAMLTLAVTHAGASQGRRGSLDNQRLEFLGDRVLGLVVAEALMRAMPKSPEGELSPRLAALVRREALAEVATRIGLGRFLILAPADAASGARGNPKMLADACEAVIGALYLDGGLEAARRFVELAWRPLLAGISAKPIEPKTALQEWAQGRGKPLPRYSVVATGGEPHRPTFDIMVEVEGLEPAYGSGHSKRDGEKAAASTLLHRLGIA